MKTALLLLVPAMLVSVSAFGTLRIKMKISDGSSWTSGATAVATSNRTISYPNAYYGRNHRWVTAFMGTQPVKFFKTEFPYRTFEAGKKWVAEAAGNHVFGQTTGSFYLTHSSSTVGTYFTSCVISANLTANDEFTLTANSGATFGYRTYYASCAGTSQCTVTEASSWVNGTSTGNIYITKNGGDQRIDFRLAANHSVEGVVAVEDSAATSYVTFNNSCTRTGYGSASAHDGIEVREAEVALE